MGNVFKSIRSQDSTGLSLKDDGGNTGAFIEDGGQVGIGGNVAPAHALDVTGAMKASFGKVVTYHYTYSAVKTENEVFDLLSAYVPTTNDEREASGGYLDATITHGIIISKIKRTGASEITLYGFSWTDSNPKTLVCTDSDATNAITRGDFVL